MKNFIEEPQLKNINIPLQERYNRIAYRWNQEEYAGLRRDDVLDDILKRSKFSEVKDGSELGVSVLEAMSGTGNVGKAVKKELEKNNKKCRLHYLDFSENMLRQIEVDAEKFLADAKEMPFSDSSFDRIYIRFGVHDLSQETQPQLFKEIYRVLKEGGMFVLTAYYTEKETQYYYNKIVNLKDELAGHKGDYDRHFPTKDEYEKSLKEAGFQGVESGSDFVGKIKYQKTIELNKETGEQWKNFVQSMPEDIQEKMGIAAEDDGTINYNFPATILTATKPK